MLDLSFSTLGRSMVRPVMVVIAGLLMATPVALAAETKTITIELKDHQFSPAQTTIPANENVVLEIVNKDASPAEFECKTLRIEKIVPPSGKISITLRALKAGTHACVDEYHEDVAKEVLLVQ